MGDEVQEVVDCAALGRMFCGFRAPPVTSAWRARGPLSTLRSSSLPTGDIREIVVTRGMVA
jgi:hypothetical protein